jgi:acid phosphatase family membrane protein YuiD
MATGSSTTTIQNSGASLSSLESILTNYPLISAFLAFAIAQSIKFFTSWYVLAYALVFDNLVMSFDSLS